MESVHKMIKLDKEDKWLLKKYIFFLDSSGYPTTHINHKQINIHNLILVKKDGLMIDHINRNTLDNRKCNLRYATYSQNSINRKLQKNNTSGYRGVHWFKITKKWKAKITCNKKRIYLGYYKSKIEAAKAYNKAAKKYFGEFAVLNNV